MAFVVRLAASGLCNLPALPTLLNKFIPFFNILSALEFRQITAMEIFCNSPKLAVYFVATHYRAINAAQAEQLCSCQAMVAGDKNGPLLAEANCGWSLKADSFNGIGKY